MASVRPLANLRTRLKNSFLGHYSLLRRKILTDVPGFLLREGKKLWERSGDFRIAAEICQQRLLAGFFDTTDFCNARCIMCATRFMKRKRAIMPVSIFHKGLEQLAEAGAHSVMLHAFGEPLLDPYLLERIQLARRFPTFQTIGLATNGSLLTADYYEKLVTKGLTFLSISIDGFRKDIYENIRIGLSFEELVKRITEVLLIHRSLGRPIQLEVNSFTSETPRQLLSNAFYQRFLQAGVVPVLKSRVDNWGGLISEVPTALWLKAPKPKRGPCALLHDAMVLILPDGRMTPCHCRDLEGDLAIGNVLEKKLLDLWRGTALETLRHEQRRGNFLFPCTQCSAYVTLRSWFTRSRRRNILNDPGLS